MPSILADKNVEGHVRMLIDRLERGPLGELWTGLGFGISTFESLGLTPDVDDQTLWVACQRNDVILITSNRSAGGPDSLQQTIQRLNQPTSPPVITLSDPMKIQVSRAHADHIARRLLEALFDLDN
jgi:hypothetical protein